MRTRALMYHDVVAGEDWESSGFPGPWSQYYKFNEAEFDQHLRAISGAWRGAAPAGGEPRDGALQITFDDGGVGARPAAAALEALGWRGYFFITTGRIGTAGFLDAAGLRELAAAGHCIGSHSVTHPTRMATLSPAELREEWKRSTETLAEILGQPAPVASVPGGYYSTEVARAAAEAGIRWLYNSEPVETVDEVDGCRILGRYAIHRGHTAGDAAAYAAGQSWICWRTRFWWDSKKLIKRAGPFYMAIARRLRQ